MGLFRRKPANCISSTVFGKGSDAEKTREGSPPKAIATGIRSPLSRYFTR